MTAFERILDQVDEGGITPDGYEALGNDAAGMALLTIAIMQTLSDDPDACVEFARSITQAVDEDTLIEALHLGIKLHEPVNQNRKQKA
jgi:hypothetical protein